MEFARLLFLFSAILLISLSRSEGDITDDSKNNLGSGEFEEKFIKEEVIPDGLRNTNNKYPENIEEQKKAGIKEEVEEEKDDNDDHENKEEPKGDELKDDGEEEDDHDTEEEELTTVAIEKVHTRPRKDGTRENLTEYENGSCQVCWSVTNLLLLVLIGMLGQY